MLRSRFSICDCVAFLACKQSRLDENNENVDPREVGLVSHSALKGHAVDTRRTARLYKVRLQTGVPSFIFLHKTAHDVERGVDVCVHLAPVFRLEQSSFDAPPRINFTLYRAFSVHKTVLGRITLVYRYEADACKSALVRECVAEYAKRDLNKVLIVFST